MISTASSEYHAPQLTRAGGIAIAVFDSKNLLVTGWCTALHFPLFFVKSSKYECTIISGRRETSCSSGISLQPGVSTIFLRLPLLMISCTKVPSPVVTPPAAIYSAELFVLMLGTARSLRFKFSTSAMPSSSFPNAFDTFAIV